MPALRQTVEGDDDGPEIHVRRPSATSLGAESTKTATSGVSQLDKDLRGDMAERVTGLMSRDSRSTQPSPAASSYSGEAPVIPDSASQANELVRPKSL